MDRRALAASLSAALAARRRSSLAPPPTCVFCSAACRALRRLSRASKMGLPTQLVANHASTPPATERMTVWTSIACLKPALPAFVRPRSHAQTPAVLDHSRTLPQGDGRAGPAFTRRAIGGERNLIVLDARPLPLAGFGNLRNRLRGDA